MVPNEKHCARSLYRVIMIESCSPLVSFVQVLFESDRNGRSDKRENRLF